MIITMQELKKMPETRYQIIDMRDAVEIAHGAIPGAVALKPEQIQDSQEVDREKTLVIVWRRRKIFAMRAWMRSACREDIQPGF